MPKPKMLLQGDEPVAACCDVGQPFPFTDPLRASALAAEAAARRLEKSRIVRPGIYRDFDPAAYFADPCPDPSLSQSLSKVLIEQSAQHARTEHPRLAPPAADDDEAEKYVKAKAIGDAAHKIVLGRGKEIEVIKFNDFKKDDAKKLRDAAYAAARVPILEKHMANVEAMVEAAYRQLRSHEDRDAFTKGSGEVVIAWQEDGIWYRSLVDWLSDDLRTVDDFKTTGMSVAPHLLGIRAETAGWHIQAAFIERGLNALDPAGAGRRRFRFIAQEQYQPYALMVAHMDEHWLTMGRKKIAAADQIWRASIKTGRWPGYPNHGMVPDYPKWAEMRWLERELSGEFERIPSLMGG